MNCGKCKARKFAERNNLCKACKAEARQEEKKPDKVKPGRIDKEIGF